MNPHEVSSLDDAVVLDVREPYEWDAGHIAGAVHIPIGQIQGRYQEVDSERTVVVVCQVGQRSALVADFLRANGYDAHNLEGGLESWLAAGMELQTSEAEGTVVDGWARDLEGRRLDGSD